MNWPPGLTRRRTWPWSTASLVQQHTTREDYKIYHTWKRDILSIEPCLESWIRISDNALLSHPLSVPLRKLQRVSHLHSSNAVKRLTHTRKSLKPGLYKTLRRCGVKGWCSWSHDIVANGQSAPALLIPAIPPQKVLLSVKYWKKQLYLHLKISIYSDVASRFHLSTTSWKQNGQYIPLHGCCDPAQSPSNSIGNIPRWNL